MGRRRRRFRESEGFPFDYGSKLEGWSHHFAAIDGVEPLLDTVTALRGSEILEDSSNPDPKECTINGRRRPNGGQTTTPPAIHDNDDDVGWQICGFLCLGCILSSAMVAVDL